MALRRIGVQAPWVLRGSSLSLSRKLKRKKFKKFKKDIGTTLNMFDKIGDECLACSKAFDKNNKEHVSTWTVVVREKEKKVNLYCPDCWEYANNLIDSMKGGQSE